MVSVKIKFLFFLFLLRWLVVSSRLVRQKIWGKKGVVKRNFDCFPLILIGRAAILCHTGTLD